LKTLFLLLGVFSWLGWTLAWTVRDTARRSPERRSKLVVGGVAMFALGVVAALLLPRRVPDTPGSSAALVMIAFLWVVGGGMAFAGAATLLGVALASGASGTPKP